MLTGTLQPQLPGIRIAEKLPVVSRDILPEFSSAVVDHLMNPKDIRALTDKRTRAQPQAAQELRKHHVQRIAARRSDDQTADWIVESIRPNSGRADRTG